MKRVINCGYKFEPFSDDRFYMTSTSTHNKYVVKILDRDEDEIDGYIKFQMSIVKPYDDADYAWAEYDGSTIKCYQNNRLVDRMNGLFYEYDRYEDFDEYCNHVFEQTFRLLEEINKTVEPRILHD